VIYSVYHDPRLRFLQATKKNDCCFTGTRREEERQGKEKKEMK
jgi:hypothetical protein